MFLRVQSFIQYGSHLEPSEVEVSLIPGLPQIIFLGLPDQAIRESAHRIRNAIRIQGFKFPKAKTVIVNIRPSHHKKTSRGLELAVAYAILALTGEVPSLNSLEDYVFYGELLLSGEILCPEDAFSLPLSQPERTLLTGTSSKELPFPSIELPELKALLSGESSLHQRLKKGTAILSVRPTNYFDFGFTEDQAEGLSLIALGWHPALLAGASGTGKSTLAKAVVEFLNTPSTHELIEIRKRNIRSDAPWRPSLSIHHTATPLSLIGGGNRAMPGELYRAHQGVLILDEFLEFSKPVQEVLRGPMESHEVRISRANQVEIYPFDTLVVGTTNLCPCGEWTPLKKINCARTLARCRSYRGRLSGPVLDRFQLLLFSDKKQRNGKRIWGHDLLEKIQKIQEFQESQVRSRNQHGNQQNAESLNITWNSRISLMNLRKQCADERDLKIHLTQELFNPRRQQAILSVARTLADMSLSELIHSEHLERAVEVAGRNFEYLKNLDDY